jgi:hypothetical protein
MKKESGGTTMRAKVKKEKVIIKDFQIYVSLKGKELYIGEDESSGWVNYIENDEDVKRCIGNYLDMYCYDKEEQNGRE